MRWFLILTMAAGCHAALPLSQREPAADTSQRDPDGTSTTDAPGAVEGPPQNDLPTSDLPPGTCAVDAPGCVSTLAGTCDEAHKPFKNGPALSATFYKPRGLAWDKVNGKLYIADSQNYCIRALENGEVSTLAGTCGSPGKTDDPNPVKASFKQPHGLALDLSGPSLVVTDTMNHKIRVVSLPSGPVSTLAGSGAPGNDDGSPLLAKFNQPRGVAVHGNHVYVADALNDAIRVIHTDTDKVGTLIKPPALDNPSGIVATGVDKLLVTDSLHHTVVAVAGTQLTKVAGSTKGLKDDQNALLARFNEPRGVALVKLPSGGEAILFVADASNHRIRAVALNKKAVATAAGTVAGYVDGPWDKAAFRFPEYVVEGPPGVLYVSDTENHCIRRYNLPP
jgi:DNA-binding beta-propeller fold protein YncE